MKTVVILGTRPEAIKLAPVIKELKKNQIEVIVASSGQHRELLDQVLALFVIKPDYDLGIMSPNQSLTEITVKTLEGLNKILQKEKPDIVIVQGDTTTAFTGALAAFYQQITIAHVEAGLRTNNKYSPFPEEINRIIIDHLADFYFAPTKTAERNLLKGGVQKDKIFVTGNTVVDALLSIIDEDYQFEPPLNQLDFSKTILVTTHRRENFNRVMKEIYAAILMLVSKYSYLEIIFPVHPSPNVNSLAWNILRGHERIHLIEPLPYRSFINLMSKCYLVMTDSGGIQEEAPALGRPVLILRETTERPEVIQGGGGKLVGTNGARIVAETSLLLDNRSEYQKMANVRNLYGDGKASQRIVQILKQHLT